MAKNLSDGMKNWLTRTDTDSITDTVRISADKDSILVSQMKSNATVRVVLPIRDMLVPQMRSNATVGVLRPEHDLTHYVTAREYHAGVHDGRGEGHIGGGDDNIGAGERVTREPDLTLL